MLETKAVILQNLANLPKKTLKGRNLIPWWIDIPIFGPMELRIFDFVGKYVCIDVYYIYNLDI